MLANLLPGVRDFRTPLASGLLWFAVIVAAATVAGSPVPTPDDTVQPVRMLFDLQDLFGSAVPLVVLTFVAYLLGILFPLGAIALWIIRRVPTIRRRWLRALLPSFLLRAPLSKATLAQGRALVSSRLADNEAFETDEEQLVPGFAKLKSMARHPSRFDPERSEAEVAVGIILDSMIGEIPLTSVRLQAESSALFDTYDRSHAEAEFRFAVIPQLSALMFISAHWIGGGWWYAAFGGAGLVVAALLALTAYFKFQKSNDVVLQAVYIGKISSPKLEELVMPSTKSTG